MSDGLLLAFRENAHLADREAVAELQEAAIRNQVTGLRKKLILRLVVTARAMGPIEASTVT
jgi:hypothetical protein